MSVFSGKYELIDSGVVIQMHKEPIKIVLDGKTEKDVAFIFNFNEDKDFDKNKVKIEANNSFELEFTFTNFNNFTNGGNTEPLEIGIFRKRILFLNYRVSALKGASYTFIYSFFLKMED